VEFSTSLILVLFIYVKNFVAQNYTKFLIGVAENTKTKKNNPILYRSFININHVAAKETNATKL